MAVISQLMTFSVFFLLSAGGYAQPLDFLLSPSCERVLGGKTQQFVNYLSTKVITGTGDVQVATLEDVVSGSESFPQFLRDRAKAYLARPIHSQSVFVVLPSTADYVYKQLASTIVDFAGGALRASKDAKRYIVVAGDPAKAVHGIFLSPLSFKRMGIEVNMLNLSRVLFHETVHLQDLDELQIFAQQEFKNLTVGFPVPLFAVLSELRAYKKQAFLIPDWISWLRLAGFEDINANLKLLSEDDQKYLLTLFDIQGEFSVASFEKYLRHPAAPPDFINLLKSFRYRFLLEDSQDG